MIHRSRGDLWHQSRLQCTLGECLRVKRCHRLFGAVLGAEWSGCSREVRLLSELSWTGWRLFNLAVTYLLILHSFLYFFFQQNQILLFYFFNFLNIPAVHFLCIVFFPSRGRGYTAKNVSLTFMGSQDESNTWRSIDFEKNIQCQRSKCWKPCLVFLRRSLLLLVSSGYLKVKLSNGAEVFVD